MKKLLAILCWLALALDAKSATTYGLTLDGANRYWSPMSGANIWSETAGVISSTTYGTNLMFNPSATGANFIFQITSNLTYDATGLWLSSPLGHVSASDRSFDELLMVEKRAVNGGGVAANIVLGQTLPDEETLALSIEAWAEQNMTNQSVTGIKVHTRGYAPATSIREMVGFYAYAPITDVGLTIFTTTDFWGEDLGGMPSTHPYYTWWDSRGVRRIKEDNTFNSVGQAIEALYNPQFTKYTPGAANHERVVLGQWNGNVAEIGTEKGGTGTLRPLRLIGAGVNVSTNLNAYSITATNGVASYSSNLTAVTIVVLSGTPALWTNTLTKNVQTTWSGGTVTGVGVNASLYPAATTGGYVILQPGEWLAFTNSIVPIFGWKPF